jgi:hypothetical protein
MRNPSRHGDQDDLHPREDLIESSQACQVGDGGPYIPSLQCPATALALAGGGALRDVVVLDGESVHECGFFHACHGRNEVAFVYYVGIVHFG